MTESKPKGKTPKCKKCGEWVDKSLNDFEKKSNGYYHNSCIAEQSIESQHYKDLIDYIIYLYNVNAPTGWMFKQIKELKESGYTYKGIEFTLRYIVDIEKMNLLDASEAGIGIVTFFYLKAGKYYGQLEEIRQSLQGVSIDSTPEIIKIERESKKKKKKINIEEL